MELRGADAQSPPGHYLVIGFISCFRQLLICRNASASQRQAAILAALASEHTGMEGAAECFERLSGPLFSSRPTCP